jgi:hypothetical protein
MVKRNVAFPKKHLCADDLNGEPVTLTIKCAQQEAMRNNGQEQTKTVLYFRDGYKPFPLNQTNWDSIADITGEDDSDNWKGHQAEAYPTTTQSPGGDIVPCVRFRAPPQGELKPQQSQPQPAANPKPAVAKPARPQPKSGDDPDEPLPVPFR